MRLSLVQSLSFHRKSLPNSHVPSGFPQSGGEKFFLNSEKSTREREDLSPLQGYETAATILEYQEPFNFPLSQRITILYG